MVDLGHNFHSIDGLDFTYYPSRPAIVCESCGPSYSWCTHFALLVSTHSDSVMFFEDYKHPQQLLLNVPMVPTRNLWTQVALVTHERFKRYSVTWTGDPKRPENAEGIFLGSISEGEGINVIRGLLTEHMLWVQSEPIACSAGHHSFAAEMEWQKTMRMPPKNQMPERWSVFAHGMCIRCRTNDPSTGDDLIPKTEGSVWN